MCVCLYSVCTSIAFCMRMYPTSTVIGTDGTEFGSTLIAEDMAAQASFHILAVEQLRYKGLKEGPTKAHGPLSPI